jgi:hypothetical protein
LESNVTGWLGVSGLSISPLGMMLLAFSIALVALSFARRVPMIFVRAIIAADLAWVLGSAVLLVMYPASLSSTGTVLVVDVALVVLAFAVIQAVGLRRAMRLISGSNGASRVAAR